MAPSLALHPAQVFLTETDKNRMVRIFTYMGVEPKIGKHLKMDGENNGKLY